MNREPTDPSDKKTRRDAFIDFLEFLLPAVGIIGTVGVAFSYSVTTIVVAGAVLILAIIALRYAVVAAVRALKSK